MYRCSRRLRRRETSPLRRWLAWVRLNLRKIIDGTVEDLRRLQVAVLGGVPKVQDARVQALGAIEALQRQPPAAVRTSGVVERPRPHGQLPAVAALAAPPHSGGIAARDVGWLEGPVPLLVPLRQQIRMPEPQTPCLGWTRSERISPSPVCCA